MTKSLRCISLLSWMLLFCATTSAQTEADSATDVAVERGREVLSDRSEYPWYDAATDNLAPVEVEPPTVRRQISLEWLTVVGWIALGLLLASVVAMLVYAFLRREVGAAAHGVASQEAAGTTRFDRVEALPIGAQVAVDDLLASARACYEQGDFARAIVLLFSHQLVELDRQHWVHLARGKTNRHYLREITHRRLPCERLLQLVDQTMVLFERSFFGNHVPTRSEMDACWDHVEQFHELVLQGAEMTT